MSIERQGQELYLTHYLKDRYGDLYLDAEMVFGVSAQGQLTLTQTATQNPFNGGEYRSNDRGFGQTFSKNLLTQGFAEAALSAFQAKQQQNQGSPEASKIADRATDSIAPPVSDAAQVKPNNRPSPSEQSPIITNNSKDEERPPLREPSLTALHLSEPPTSSSINRTKPSSIKSAANFKSTQVHEPQGIQLSLFDVGLNPNPIAEVKSISQSPKHQVETQPPIQRQVGEEVAPNSGATNTPPASTLDRPGGMLAPGPAQEVKPPTSDQRIEAATPNQQAPNNTSLAQPSVNTADNSSDRLVDPMRIFQEVVDRIDRQTGEKLAAMQSASPSLDTLRDWYKAARELGKPEKHLDRIAEIGQDFKRGEPLTEKAQAVMHRDLQAHYQRVAVVEQLGLLPDRDLLGLHQVVDNYLNNAPFPPPPETERRVVYNQANQLVEQINSLGKEQSDAIASVEAMQKNPLRNWDGKYIAATALVQQNAHKLESMRSLYQQKTTQLEQWNKQGQAYQTWNKDSQTVDMKLLASGLSSPQIQERLATLLQQSQQRQAQLAAGQQKGDWGQGLSV